MARPRGKKAKYPFNIVGFEKYILWRWTDPGTPFTRETMDEHSRVRMLDWHRFYRAMRAYENRNGVEFQYRLREEGVWVKRFRQK